MSVVDPGERLARGRSERAIVQERRSRLAQFRAAGIDPFPRRYAGRVPIADVLVRPLCSPPQGGTTHRVAGRVAGRRRHGKVIFLDLADRSGEIELLARRDILGDVAFEQLASVQRGDQIGVDGRLVADAHGSPVLWIGGWTLLAKTLRVVPDKHHGITDVETRLRKRVLDLLSSSEAREVVIMRSRFIAALRGWLTEQGMLEVETPVLQPLPGGALARPFHTHHNALDRDYYLRIASELYLKRCVVGGLDDVFTIGKCFRNEGLSSEHSPEFSLLEWYRVGADYNDAADLTEAMILAAARRALGRSTFQRAGEQIDLARPWRRVTFREALVEVSGVDPASVGETELARRLGVAPVQHGRAEMLARLFARDVEPTLVQPTFVFDLPIEFWPVARRHRTEAHAAEAFEAFVGGLEIGCGATDITDPDEQRARFVEQQALSLGGDAVHPEDEDFVQALELGMMPIGGSGIGLDRLIMLLAERGSVREVLTFPTLRPQGGEQPPDDAGASPPAGSRSRLAGPAPRPDGPPRRPADAGASASGSQPTSASQASVARSPSS